MLNDWTDITVDHVENLSDTRERYRDDVMNEAVAIFFTFLCGTNFNSHKTHRHTYICMQCRDVLIFCFQYFYTFTRRIVERNKLLNVLFTIFIPTLRIHWDAGVRGGARKEERLKRFKVCDIKYTRNTNNSSLTL